MNAFSCRTSRCRASLLTGALLTGPAALYSATGCAGFPDSNPQTNVVLENHYPPSSSKALVVYDAYWLNVSFAGNPIAPGSVSNTLTAVPNSGNTAYVVLAPGWDPTSMTPPTSFVVMQSRNDYGVALGQTVHIPVDDTAFEGDCAAGSHLTSDQADFLTQIVFAGDFANTTYDPSTCTTTPTGDASAE